MYKMIKWAYNVFEPLAESFFSSLVYIFKYRKFKAISMVKKGFEDHRSQANVSSASEVIIIERLIKAYNEAKETQKGVSRPYQVGHMWQEILDNDFHQLSSTFSNNDFEKARTLLENFNREVCSSKMGGGYDCYYRMKNVPLFKYQFINTWYEFCNVYEELTGNGPELIYPLVGNPVGLFYDEQVVPYDAIEYRYYAGEIQRLLNDIDNPIICEIGSGIGNQAYSVLANSERKMTYVLLDIPEVLVLASYFLMLALPDKKVLLYGEAPLDSNTLHQYDIILMPNFVLSELKNKSIDLVFNSCSLSEMDSVTSEEYVHQIERICLKYFMHVNHTARFTWQEEGRTITNIPADKIEPDRSRFRLIYQKPRRFALLQDKVFYWRSKSNHFAFLYQRM